MIRYYMTENRKLSELSAPESGCWIVMVAPDDAESRKMAEFLNVDLADLRAALDEEESSRVSIEDDYTLILTDIPTSEKRNGLEAYTTIPLGIILKEGYLVTVCAEESSVLQFFVEEKMKNFSTKKRMRFLYQIMYRNCVTYQSCLRNIDKKRIAIESRINDETEELDLISLHEMESDLVYFATSLHGNEVVLDRLTRYERIKQYPEDKELLEDVIVENKQAIEMTAIYRDIINNTSELFSTIVDNRLNNVMKILTSVTLVMAVPTIISGFYGMNVNGEGMPFSETPAGFTIISIITLIICIVVLVILHRRRML